MDYCWNSKNNKLTNTKISKKLSWYFALAESNNININIIIQKIVHHYIPASIISSKFFWIPPVSIKLSIREFKQFGKYVKPRMQKHIKC